VPWASQPSISFLRAPGDVLDLLERTGFRQQVWHDITAESRDWWRARMGEAAARSAPPPLSVHLLLGPDTPTRLTNLMRNLDEERVSVIQAVLEKA
jgi:hypothetical protein